MAVPANNNDDQLMNRREFQFKEGKSDKFWHIELEGDSFTVQFGRTGTAGQSQTKSFSSDDEARKACEKLIAEKLKKGYAETGSTTTAAAATATATKKSTAKAAAPVAKPKATPAVSAEAPRPPEPPPPVDVNVTGSIALTPTDWAWATWRKGSPLERPAPKPFDLGDCQRRLSAIRVQTYGWDWDWTKAQIADSLSREEAHFWFCAMTKASHGHSPADLGKDLAREKFTGELAVKDVVSAFRSARSFFDHHFVAALANLFSTEELFGIFTSGPVKVRQSRHQMSQSDETLLDVERGHIIIEGFRRHVVPFLPEADREKYRKRFSAQIDPKIQPPDYYGGWPIEYYFGALFGCPEVQAVVAAIPDGHYGKEEWSDYYHAPQWLVFGLNDPKLVQAEMRRLKLRLKDPDDIRAWLAHTEYSALGFVRDNVLAETNRDKATELLEAFALVNAPEAAAPMLELKLASKAPGVARQWLEDHLGNAIAGLVPAAAGRGKLAEAAMELLLEQKRKGFEPAIRAATEKAAPEVADVIRREVLERVEKVYPPFDEKGSPAWLSKAVDSAAALKFRPLTWAHAGMLPPLVLGEHRLSDDQVQAVLRALQSSWFDKMHPLITGLREHGERNSLDAFAWRLFDLWITEGAPSKEKWAFATTGMLGGDAIALKLTPLIRAWPGESQHQRAVTGLECLRAIGTDTALMQLNGIAQKLKFKGLKARAMELMEAIAGDRGLTRGQLEDRIVPDCDLDEGGSRVFDFGPRQFRFALGPEMKPMVRDRDGKLRDDLPSPNSQDNAELANAAVAEWKLLKKQIREVTKIQAVRLEQAMVTGRRWSASEFQTLLVKHPLMTNLVRLLLWAGYDQAGQLVTTFRVTEDQTCADPADKVCQVGKDVQVGIAHPLHLNEEQKAAWGEIFSDYEIIPPFQQIGRPTYGLEDGEAGKKELARWEKIKIPATALVGTLERLSWQRGIPQDAGIFHEHSKPFYGANVTAVVGYNDGVPVGYMEGWEDQEITGCFFVPGIYKPEMYPEHKDALKLKEIDPVVISEVLKDLTVIASKGK